MDKCNTLPKRQSLPAFQEIRVTWIFSGLKNRQNNDNVLLRRLNLFLDYQLLIDFNLNKDNSRGL